MQHFIAQNNPVAIHDIGRQRCQQHNAYQHRLSHPAKTGQGENQRIDRHQGHNHGTEVEGVMAGKRVGFQQAGKKCQVTAGNHEQGD
ncbi:MAG: hypothetical protein ACD_10C00600G0001 [uncultured bacterium]|nr:MAG: hypothetical protein ACD_10C00600G0001 [uncultured bacterium]